MSARRLPTWSAAEPAPVDRAAYWRELLREPIERVELPADRPRRADRVLLRGRRAIELPPDLVAVLRGLSRDQGTALFAILLAGFKVLLHRHTGQEDILVLSRADFAGSPEGARQVRSSQPLVLRSDLSGDPAFSALLRRIDGGISTAQANADWSFTQLLAGQPGHPAADHPAAQIVFALISAGADGPHKIAGTGSLALDKLAARSELALVLCEDGDRVSGAAEFDATLFDASTIDRILDGFDALLRGIAASPGARLSELPILGASAREQILVDWNRTEQPFPADRRVHELIQEQVERTPDAVAVVADDARLTYRELDARAGALARHLREQGARRGALVGISVSRTTDVVVGLLAILKSGAAYVPLDPAYPRERLSFVLADAGIDLVVTESALASRFTADGKRIVCLDALPDDIGGAPAAGEDAGSGPDDLAYVIYTSGSTGVPKGVEIPHRAAVNFLTSMRQRPGMTAADVLLAVTTISFDIAVLELFLPLTVGARVVVASQEVAKDGQLLKAALHASRATVMQATPATWRLLLEGGWTGSPGLTVLCGGEAMSPELARELTARARAVWNLYGPTETTVWSTIHPVDASALEGSVSIGRPIANTEIYILDRALAPVPIGVIGELYIGGAGVAKGYRHRPELTAERFIGHPFRAGGDARLYRTGDRARYRADGTIEFLGRNDTQVKVRGFRIELGEIESALARCAAVRQAAVVVHEEVPGDKRLVAYLVPGQWPPPPNRDVRGFLLECLPDFMVPAAYVWLEALPLTPNGKVDRRSLPAPQRTASAHPSSFVAPRDRLEARLAKSWQRALHVRPIGVRDDFFELGGNSILAMRLCEHIERRHKKNLSPAALFESPTIEQLADLLRKQGSSESSWSLVNPFQTTGTRPPFFCVYGNAALAQQFGNDQPVYVLQLHTLAGRRPPATVEATAAEYVTEIRNHQPAGPYFLGGYSFGALVVFEIAQQLARQGEKVALLTLLDPDNLHDRQYAGRDPAPAPAAGEPASRAKRVLANVGGHVRTLAGLGWSARLAYVRDYVRDRGAQHLEVSMNRAKRLVCEAYLALGWRLPVGLRVFYFLETSRRTSAQYTPSVYDGPALLIRTPYSSAHLEPYWKELIAGAMEVHEVVGRHTEIVREPGVRILARKIQASLNRVQAMKSLAERVRMLLSFLTCLCQVDVYCF